MNEVTFANISLESAMHLCCKILMPFFSEAGGGGVSFNLKGKLKTNLLSLQSFKIQTAWQDSHPRQFLLK